MANSEQEMRDAVSAYITAAWNTATSSAPLLYDNPFPGQEPPTDGTTWGRLHIRQQSGTRASLGGTNAKHRRRGTIYFQVFVRVGKGTELSNTIGEALVRAFEDATPAQVDGVWFTDASSRPVGQNDATYFQVNVEAGFTYDRNT